MVRRGAEAGIVQGLEEGDGECWMAWDVLVQSFFALPPWVQ